MYYLQKGELNKKRIEEIIKFIENTPCKGSIINHFTNNNRRYPLDEFLCIGIYGIISELSKEKEKKILEKTAAQSHNSIQKYIESKLFDKLLIFLTQCKTDNLDKELKKGEDIIFFVFMSTIALGNKERLILEVSSLVSELLRINLYQNYWSGNNNNSRLLTTPFNALASIIGEVFIRWIGHQLDKHIVKLLEEENISRITQEYSEEKERILSLIWCQIRRTKPTNKRELHTFIKDWLYYSNQLKENYVSNKKGFWINHNIGNIQKMIPETDIKMKKEFFEHFSKLRTTLGCCIINLLQEAEILDFAVNNDSPDKMLCFSKKHLNTSAFMSADDIHPTLSPLMKPKTNSKAKGDFGEIYLKSKNPSNLDKDSDNRKDTSEKFKLVIDYRIKKLLNTNKSAFTINIEFKDLVIEYINTINNETNELPFESIIDNPDSNLAKKYFNYISVIYGTNEIQEYIKTNYPLICENIVMKNRIKALLNFMNDFREERIYDNSLILLWNKELETLKAKIARYNKDKNKKKETKQESSSFLKYLDIKFKSKDEYLDKLHSEKKLLTLNISYLNRTIPKKIYIYNSLTEIMLYSHFEKWYLPEKITGTGRKKSFPQFLGYQSDKFSLPFIEGYTNSTNYTEKEFEIYKEILVKHFPNVKEKIEKLSYNQWQEQKNNFVCDHLCSNMFNNANIKKIKEFTFTSLKEAIVFVNDECGGFKKTESALLSLSLLYFQSKSIKNEIKREPLILFDLRMAGTQNFSTIFKNKPAALNCNLYEDKTIYPHDDTCNKFLEEFKELIVNKISKMAETSMTWLNITEKDTEGLSPVNILLLIEDKLKALGMEININKDNFSLQVYLSTMCKLDIDSLNPPKFNEQDLEKVNTLFTDQTFVMRKNEPIMQNIIIILSNIIIKEILNSEPYIKENLDKRLIIKKRIMADLYGMTKRGGKDSIFDAFYEFSIKGGIFSINKLKLNIIAEFMSNYYESYFAPKYLSYVKPYLKLSNYLSAEPVVFNIEGILSWTLQPLELLIVKKIHYFGYDPKSNEKGTKVTKKRQAISVSIYTNRYDLRSIKRTFPSAAIHCCEGVQAIFWIRKCIAVHKELKEKLNKSFIFVTNYDCYGVSITHTPIAIFTVEDIIMEMYNFNFHQYYKNCFNNIKDATKRNRALQLLDQLVEKQDSSNFWDGTINCKRFIKAD